MSGLRRTPSRPVAASVALVLAAAALVGCAGEPDDDAATASGERVSLQVIEGPGGQVAVLIPVFIGGEGPFGFALDTGASQSLVDQEIVDQLGLEVTGSAGEVTGVAGSAQAQLVEIDEWRLGERLELEPATITTLDLPEPDGGPGLEGLLGADVLSGFGSVLIDFEDEVLVVEPRSEASGPRSSR